MGARQEPSPQSALSIPFMLALLQTIRHNNSTKALGAISSRSSIPPASHPRERTQFRLRGTCHNVVRRSHLIMNPSYQNSSWLNIPPFTKRPLSIIHYLSLHFRHCSTHPSNYSHSCIPHPLSVQSDIGCASWAVPTVPTTTQMTRCMVCYSSCAEVPYSKV